MRKLSLVSRSSKDISENFPKKNFFTETLSMLDVCGMQLSPNMQPFWGLTQSQGGFSFDVNDLWTSPYTARMGDSFKEMLQPEQECFICQLRKKSKINGF